MTVSPTATGRLSLWTPHQPTRKVIWLPAPSVCVCVCSIRCMLNVSNAGRHEVLLKQVSPIKHLETLLRLLFLALILLRRLRYWMS